MMKTLIEQLQNIPNIPKKLPNSENSVFLAIFHV